MSQRLLTPSPEVWLHILFGDENGGGHLHGFGREGKTEFPEYWTLTRIEHAVMAAISNVQNRNRELLPGFYDEFVDGIILRIVLTKDLLGPVKISTAHPVRGNGVFRKINGVLVSKPLLRQDRRK